MISYWNNAGQKTTVHHLKSAKRSGGEAIYLKLYIQKNTFQNVD